MNPMLAEIHYLETQKSTLLYMITGLAFLIMTPVAIILRTK